MPTKNRGGKGTIDEAWKPRVKQIKTAWKVQRKIGRWRKFSKYSLDSSEGVMKNFSGKENCGALDRLATWDEVRYAMTFWSQGASELGCTLSGHRDLKSDAAGRVDVFSEKLEWLALISERLNRNSN